MQWGSATEFFAMGGYGLYVWTSFGATALCMVSGSTRSMASTYLGGGGKP